MTRQHIKAKRETKGARSAALLLLLFCATGTAGAVDAKVITPRLPAPQSIATGVFFKFEEFFGSNTRSSNQKTFRELDRDRDGSLSVEELQYAFGSQFPSMLRRLDNDRDGRVTREEVRGRNEPQGTSRAEGSARQEQRSEPETRNAERTSGSQDNGSRGASGNQGGESSSGEASGNGRSDDRGANGNGNGPR